MGWWVRKTHLPSSHYLRCFFSGSESSLQDCSRKPGVPLWSPLSPGMLAALLPDPGCHRSTSGTGQPLTLWVPGESFAGLAKKAEPMNYFGPFLITIYLLSKSRGGVFMSATIAGQLFSKKWILKHLHCHLFAGDVLQKCSLFCFSISKELRQTNNKKSLI